MKSRRFGARSEQSLVQAPRRARSRALSATVALALTAATLVCASARADVAIPFTRTSLPNGMVVILHEDHAVPTVVV